MTLRRTTSISSTARTCVLAAALAAGSLLAACGGDEDAETPSDTATPASVTIREEPDTSSTADISTATGAGATVVYRYRDSSVAPEYHRSYTLTIVAREANLVVDSYGDVLHDVTEPISTDLWEQTLAAATSFAGAPDVTSADPCSGGTGEQLTVTDGSGDEVVAVSIDHCETSGADVEDAVADVLALFDMEALLATA